MSLPKLCICGRQYAYVGGLRYCTGCNLSVCNCIIEAPGRAILLRDTPEDRERLIQTWLRLYGGDDVDAAADVGGLFDALRGQR